MAPGERLIETALAQRLGISRTPLREAIRRLTQQGWVLPQESGGAIVRPLSGQDLMHSYATRAVLEGLAARLACGNVEPLRMRELEGFATAAERALAKGDISGMSMANAQFHEGIAALSRNPWLIEMLERLSIHSVYYRRLVVAAASTADGRARYVTYVRQRIRDHFELLDRLERMTPNDAEVLMRAHTEENAKSVARLLGLSEGERRQLREEER